MADTLHRPDAPRRSIGVIGLGLMGGAMASNLVAGGWRVIGYDIDAEGDGSRQAEGHRGGRRRGRRCRGSVRHHHLAPERAGCHRSGRDDRRSGSRSRVIVEMSTLALEDKETFAAVLTAKGHIALDCPLSGTGAQAQGKDLVVYASGSSTEIERLGPLFLGLGRRVLQSRCLRQRHQNEVCRQSVGCDSQRRQCRGHGARDESRAGAAADRGG